jgi:hypothetical protein
MTCFNLCLIFQAVVCATPRRRPSSILLGLGQVIDRAKPQPQRQMLTKPGVSMARPRINSDRPLTPAERQARRYDRKKKSICRKRRRQRKQAKLDAKSQDRREVARAAPPLPAEVERRVGDCREVVADIASDSVPLILTDPPYGGPSEPLYRWLAEFAARVLIPGGSLICFTGHFCLDRDMRIFSEHLEYWWLLVMLHDQSPRFPSHGAIACHKPVLWYVKTERRRPRPLIADVLTAKRAKTMHEWAQGDGGIWPIVDKLTDPGELIVDPFCGTGEWGRIAHEMGRRWLGCDINPERGQ